METYPIKDNDGFQHGFEIEVVYVSPKKISKILSKVDGVTNIQNRKMFDMGNEIHIEFDFLGEKFVVWEPYGDSSRYWLCLKDKHSTSRPDISRLEKAFVQYNPPAIVRLFGDLISLNFKKLLKLN